MRLFILSFIMGISLLGCKEKKSQNTQDYVRPVRVIYAKTLGTIQKDYVGSVQPTLFSELAFKVGGELISLPISSGEQVKKGALIAAIDPYDYRLQVTSAEANYVAAKSNFERTKALYEQNAVAKQNLESAEAVYIQAKSALDFARNTLQNCQLRAPFDGFIEQTYVDNHEVVSVGQKIAKLVNPDEIDVKFTLPESNIMAMSLPKTIYVKFETIKGRMFKAKIKENFYASDGSGVPITLSIDDPNFNPFKNNVFPGFSCTVKVVFDNKISNSYILPSSAIMHEDSKLYVWIVNEQTKTLEKKEVQGTIHGKDAVIYEGLTPNNMVVTAGVGQLKEGEKVNIATKL